MTCVSLSQPHEPVTAGVVVTDRLRSTSSLAESATGESNCTISGMPMPTTEPLPGSTWYVAVTLAASVVKLLLDVSPDAAEAETVYLVAGRRKRDAVQLRPSDDSAPAIERCLESVTVTLAIGPPCAVTVTVVFGATEATPLAGVIARLVGPLEVD